MGYLELPKGSPCIPRGALVFSPLFGGSFALGTLLVVLSAYGVRCQNAVSACDSIAFYIRYICRVSRSHIFSKPSAHDVYTSRLAQNLHTVIEDTKGTINATKLTGAKAEASQ